MSQPLTMETTDRVQVDYGVAEEPNPQRSVYPTLPTSVTIVAERVSLALTRYFSRCTSLSGLARRPSGKICCKGGKQMTVDCFLKIDGIQGESTDPKHKDEI